MNKICFVLALAVFVHAAPALAEVPPVVVKSVDELTQIPASLPLEPVEIVEDAPVSALDPEGIVPLLMLTPKEALARWGKPQEVTNTDKAGKSYTWANGYTLDFTEAGQVRRILYWPPQDVVLPFSAAVLADLGFAPSRPDVEGPQRITWKSEAGCIKSVLLEARTVNGEQQLGTLQIVLNP